MDMNGVNGADDPEELLRDIRREFGAELYQGRIGMSRRIVNYLHADYGQDYATIARNLGSDPETVERIGRGEGEDAFSHEQIRRLRMFYAEPMAAMFRTIFSRERVPQELRPIIDRVLGTLLDEYDRPGDGEPEQDG